VSAFTSHKAQIQVRTHSCFAGHSFFIRRGVDIALVLDFAAKTAPIRARSRKKPHPQTSKSSAVGQNEFGERQRLLIPLRELIFHSAVPISIAPERAVVEETQLCCFQSNFDDDDEHKLF
jgi:hypothetical protein